MRYALLLLLVPILAQAQPREQLTRRRLTAPAVYGDVSCAPTGRASATFFATGAVEGCPLLSDTTISGHRLPAGTWVYLTEQRRLRSAWLSRDTELQGHRCRGGGYREWSTEFYTSGQLRVCYLAGDAEIDGVPCHGASFIAEVRRSTQLQLHANGRLRECRLARVLTRAEGRFAPPLRITLDSAGRVLGTAKQPSPLPPPGQPRRR